MRDFVGKLCKYPMQFKKCVKRIYAASHKYFILYSMVMAVETVLPYLPIWIMRHLLNRLTAYQLVPSAGLLPEIMWLAVSYCAIFLLQITFGNTHKLIAYKYNDAIDYYFDNLLIDKISGADLSYFDSSTLSDQMQNASKYVRSTTQDIVFSLFDTIQGIVRLILSALMIGTLGLWTVPCIVLLCIPTIMCAKKTGRENYEFSKTHNINQRKMSYYKALFFGDAREEIQLYGLTDYFTKKYSKEWESFRCAKNKVNLSNFGRDVLSRLFSTGVEILAYLVAIVKLVSHSIGVGDVTYYVSLATNFRLYITGIVNRINKFDQDSCQLDDILAFIDLEPEAETGGTRLPGANPQIEFRGVSFRYPSSEEYILKNCSFVLEPGQMTGLVGLNGAGKSTIVKLLLRFYNPTEGQILIDGVDAKEYDLTALRKQFGVMFQDFCSYSMTLRENIAMADISGIADEGRLRDACMKSRAEELIAGFENGMDENLTKRFDENGKELSGGGWQRIALARAFFRQSPIVLLDEPSASLDPLAEHEIFSRFAELSDGRTTMLISHRLSNIVRCDKILVLSDGRIVEQGSHKELLDRGGQYAHLFQLQASKYV